MSRNINVEKVEIQIRKEQGKFACNLKNKFLAFLLFVVVGGKKCSRQPNFHVTVQHTLPRIIARNHSRKHKPAKQK